MQEQRPIRILLCEDQTLMREGLKTILELDGGSPPFQIIGEASDGEEAVRQANKLSPDIVLMDVQMPRQNGVQATAAISATLPATRVIILTTFDNEDYVFEAIKAGATGYLLKDTPANELVATIRRIHQGESFIQPKVATRLLIEFGRRGAAPHGPAAEEEDLSQRELDVLKLLAQGASNREIATRLVLAEGTIKNHVSNILIKLHAANRTQAANMARERGLI
jgi:DNA-binding NarL/FixJ family response regulator